MKTTCLVALVLVAACGQPGGADAGADCSSTSTPPNLLPNPGFECGLTGWFARDGALRLASGGHGGSSAAQLTVSAAGAATLATEQPVMPLSSATYCATAWVQGTAPAAVLTLRKVTPGGVEDFTFTDTVSASTWARLPPTLRLSFDGTGGTQVLVLVQSKNAAQGDSLLVDDLDLWVSAAGDCNEAR